MEWIWEKTRWIWGKCGVVKKNDGGFGKKQGELRNKW